MLGRILGEPLTPSSGRAAIAPAPAEAGADRPRTDTGHEGPERPGTLPKRVAPDEPQDRTGPRGALVAAEDAEARLLIDLAQGGDVLGGEADGEGAGLPVCRRGSMAGLGPEAVGEVNDSVQRCRRVRRVRCNGRSGLARIISGRSCRSFRPS